MFSLYSETSVSQLFAQWRVPIPLWWWEMVKSEMRWGAKISVWKFKTLWQNIQDLKMEVEVTNASVRVGIS